MNIKLIKPVILFSIIVFTAILLPVMYTLCENDSNFENQYISAVIYDNAQYAQGGVGLNLTKSGVDIKDWNYKTSKYLQINTKLPNDGNTYKIVISTPREFYFVTNDFTLPAGFSNVKFKKNDNFTVNGNQTYNVNVHSGEVSYTVDKGITNATLQFELTYDFNLWNKVGKSRINQINKKTVEIKLYKVEDDEDILVDNLNINDSFSKDNYEYLFYNYIYSNDTQASSSGTAEYLISDTTSNLNTRILLLSKLQESFNTYAKELIYEFHLPVYKDSTGKKHILNYDWDNIKFFAQLAKGADYTIDKSNIDNGIVNIKFNNIYFANSYQFALYFSFPNDIDLNVAEEFLFQAESNSVIYVIDNDQEKISLASTKLLPIKYFKKSSENVSFNSTSITKPVPYEDLSNNVINELGYFQIKNLGTGDSNQKNVLVEFDDKNTNLIKVTTMRLPIDTKQKAVKITYSLVDDAGNNIYFDSNGNIVPEGTAGASTKKFINLSNGNYSTSNVSAGNKSILFYRGLLPTDERKYYFKTIEYKIEIIKANTLLYNNGNARGISTAGTFFGYTEKVNKAEKVTTKMTIKSDGFSNISAVNTTSFAKTPTSQFGIDNIKVNNTTSSTSILAGDSVTISGDINVFDYPYGNTFLLNNIVMGLLLPKGISINEESIVLKLENGTLVNVDKVESEDLYNGFKMWKIYIDKNTVIGVLNENLNISSIGRKIRFSLQLNTEYYLNQQSVLLANSLYVASDKTDTMLATTNTAGGAKAWATKVDTYDLNGNGSKTDNIGGVSVSITTSFEILAQKANIDIDDSVRLNGGVKSNNIIFKSSSDIAEYDLSINCTNGGEVNNFEYYIPIPKKTSGIDSFMINTKDKIVELELQEKATITGDDLFDILYTTTTELNINNMPQKDILWMKASEITDFSDITMLKIIPKDEIIRNGSKSNISIKLKYGRSNFDEEAGNLVFYHSAGKYAYIVNGRETIGTFNTKGVTISLNYNKDFSDISLTAAPNRNPKKTGNIVTYQIKTTDLPTFVNAHKFQIVNVETNNVTLQTKEYINNNLNMEGIYANEIFGITVSLNNGSEINVLASANNSPINVGTSVKNTNVLFKYTIYNANNLSDNSTNRYIIVTMKSDNGVTIKQKININRELAEASDPVSAIVAGNRYQLFDDTTKTINISKDASFTSQFVFDYIPNFYGEKILTFSSNLPIGTTLTMIDYIDNNNPTYWYYKVTNPIKNILLSDFKKMGYTNINYTNVTKDINVNEKYIMIVDFLNADNITVDNYKVYLEIKGKSVDDVSSVELTALLKDKRTFNLSTDKTSIGFNEDINISYSMVASEGVESNYLGKKISYVIKTTDNLPLDTYVECNNTKYFLNSKNEIIVPLNDVISDNASTKLNFKSLINNEISKYNLVIELLVGTTSNASSPLLGNVVASKNLILNNTNNIDKPSFKILGISNRIIKKEELQIEQKLTFNYIPKSNMKLYMELQQKVGTGYQKLTDKLNKVNGVTNHNLGEFEINSTNEAVFKLSNSMENGTYRILFTIKDDKGNLIYEIPYAIIVCN